MTIINKIFITLSLCLLTLQFACFSAVAYDLPEAINHGLGANLTIKAQELAIQEAQSGKLQAYGNFLPIVSLIYQKTHLSNDDDNLLINTDNLSQDRTFQSARVSQPIFTGYYGLSAVLKADYIIKYQTAELANAKGRLVFDISRQFIQYLKLSDDANTIQGSVQRLGKQLQAAQAFYNQQMAPKLHVLQAEVALAQAEQELTLIETKQEATRLTLNQLLQLSLGQLVPYSGTLEEMDYNLDSNLAQYVQMAKSRPDVKEAELNVKISEQESIMILSQNMPKVSVDFSYNKDKTEYDNTRSYTEDVQYWSSVINFSMKLFNGGQTIASSIKQKTTTKRYRQILKELLSKIQMDVTNSYASLLEASQRITSATKIKEAASRSYERAERRYRSGLGTSVDVLNAQDDVSRSEADIVRAMADFQTIKAELFYLSGEEYSLRN